MVDARVTGGGGGGGGAALGGKGSPSLREIHADQVPFAVTPSRARTACQGYPPGQTKSAMPGGCPGAHRHPSGYPRTRAVLHRPFLRRRRPEPPFSPAHHAPRADRGPYPWKNLRRHRRHGAARANETATCPAAWPHQRAKHPHPTSSCALRSCESLPGATSPPACVQAPPTNWRTGPRKDPPPDRPRPRAPRGHVRRPPDALILETTRCRTPHRSVPRQTPHQTETQPRAPMSMWSRPAHSS